MNDSKNISEPMTRILKIKKLQIMIILISIGQNINLFNIYENRNLLEIFILIGLERMDYIYNCTVPKLRLREKLRMGENPAPRALRDSIY